MRASRTISIHALREEGDLCIPCACWLCPKFLSTPSARRATSLPHSTDCGYTISIHALREEGDTPANIGSGRPCDFYPRPPRGGRRLPSCKSLTCRTFLSTPSARRATFSQASTCRSKSFLSTPSARRATDNIAVFFKTFCISIHALREEGDAVIVSVGLILSNFYPRPPRGGRLWPDLQRMVQKPISIHALREEGDRA